MTNFFRLITVMLFAFQAGLGSKNGGGSKTLPLGVLKALSAEEKSFCDQFEDKKNCAQKFRVNLLWRELEIAPARPVAFLVENHNLGACGSAGCSLFLFVQERDGEFVQVLGMDGDIGELNRIKALKDTMQGHYKIQKTWADGKTNTTYVWNGSRYEAASK